MKSQLFRIGFLLMLISAATAYGEDQATDPLESEVSTPPSGNKAVLSKAARDQGNLEKELTQPAPEGRKPLIQSIKLIHNGVELVADVPITEYDAFKIETPERLVIDLPRAGISTKIRELKIGDFGVKQLRVGVYSDKIRLVFDSAGKEGLPLHIIKKLPRGIKITFASVGGSKE